MLGQIRNCSGTIMRQASILQKTMPAIGTYVFLDLETTGLPKYEYNQTKITELSLIAIQSDHLKKTTDSPRVQNKLTLCFNPWKRISDESERITGLSNFLLEEQSKFSDKTVDTINLFLDHNVKPICFIAHNGHSFDYPILKQAVEKTGKDLIENVYCVDSLQAFIAIDNMRRTELQKAKAAPEIKSPVEVEGKKVQLIFEAAACLNSEGEFDEPKSPRNSDEERQKWILGIQKMNETTPKKQSTSTASHSGSSKRLKTEISFQEAYYSSYKLLDVYKRVANKNVEGAAHRAEVDVQMLIACVNRYGTDFINWAEQNAISFNDIKPMTPGKKLGT